MKIKPAAKERALAMQARKRRELRLARISRSWVIMVATVLSLSAGGLVLADQLFRPDAFNLEQLEITGAFTHVQPADVELAVAEQLESNFFSVDLERVKQEAEGLNWVRNASVRRKWPNGVSIRIQEHVPVMRWGETRWVNSFGEIVDLPGLQAAPGVVSLIGPEREVVLMVEHAYDWQQQLRDMGLELVGVNLTPWHAWKLDVTATAGEVPGRFVVLLGRDDTVRRWQRFVDVFRRYLAVDVARLDSVDARYPNGLAIRRAPQATQEKDPGRV